MRLALISIVVVACGGSAETPSAGSGSAPPAAPPPDGMPIDAAVVVDAAEAAAPPDAMIIGHGTGTAADLYNITVTIDCPRVDGAEVSVGQRVVRARMGVFRACFQKELTRGAHDGATDVSFGVKDGVPTNVTIAGDSPSQAVTDCTRANILRLKFPPAVTAVRCAMTYKHSK